MSLLKTIRLRIGSIKNTQQITKAMKMVSASKLRRSQMNIESLRPFSDSIQMMVSRLYAFQKAQQNVFFLDRGIKKVRIFVISTDKGLCGALNANVFKKVLQYIHQELRPQGVEPELVLFGKKAVDFFRKREFSILAEFADFKENVIREKILSQARSLVQEYSDGGFNSLVIFFNRYYSMVRQEAEKKVILPILYPEEKEGEFVASYEFEPSSEEILRSLIPIYMENQAFQALLDNIASEHSARMTAMDSATKNAGEILTSLQLQYNRARQAMITKELIEIISGAESLH